MFDKLECTLSFISSLEIGSEFPHCSSPYQSSSKKSISSSGNSKSLRSSISEGGSDVARTEEPSKLLVSSSKGSLSNELTSEVSSGIIIKRAVRKFFRVDCLNISISYTMTLKYEVREYNDSYVYQRNRNQDAGAMVGAFIAPLVIICSFLAMFVTAFNANWNNSLEIKSEFSEQTYEDREAALKTHSIKIGFIICFRIVMLFSESKSL